MKLSRLPLVLAIACVVIVPVSLVAQGGATKTPPAQKATPPATAAKSTPAQNPAPAQVAAAATATEQAKCKDGSMYSGASRKGACSSHGGVAQWLTGANAVPKGATARCGDGTYYTKAERQGACSGHKGVAEWLKKKS